MRLLAALLVAATAWVQPVAAMTSPSQRIKFGPDGPAADARAAAKAGNFGLVWSVGMLGRYPMGIDCNGPIQFAPEEFILAIRVHGDELPDPCRELAGACEYEARLDGYGPAYNRALVDKPGFPFPDVCGPAAPVQERRPWKVGLDQYATPIREVEGPPHDLHEAARRGTVAQVKRQLRRHAVDEIDAFSFTPLAWATIRKRPEIVAVLVKAGGKPFPDTEYGGNWRMPLWLAYRFGCSECARTLQSTATPDEIDDALPDLLDAAIEGGHKELLADLLKFASPDQQFEELFLKGGLSPEVRDTLLTWGPPAAASDLLYAAGRRGDLASVRLALSKGAHTDGRASPLGEIVLGERTQDEELLEAFISAGEDVNKIAVAGGDSGSLLRLAVKHAHRRFWRGEEQLVVERHQRIIRRLLRAGAKPSTGGGAPPLAFIAVIGPNIDNDAPRGARIEPLPTEILQALIDSGMDINEPAGQRTALDWVLAADPTSPVVGALRALGARSTATPATAPPTPRTP
jgi:hypothetical protein